MKDYLTIHQVSMVIQAYDILHDGLCGTSDESQKFRHTLAESLVSHWRAYLRLRACYLSRVTSNVDPSLVREAKLASTEALLAFKSKVKTWR